MDKDKLFKIIKKVAKFVKKVIPGETDDVIIDVSVSVLEDLLGITPAEKPKKEKEVSVTPS